MLVRIALGIFFYMLCLLLSPESQRHKPLMHSVILSCLLKMKSPLQTSGEFPSLRWVPWADLPPSPLQRRCGPGCLLWGGGRRGSKRDLHSATAASRTLEVQYCGVPVHGWAVTAVCSRRFLSMVISTAVVLNPVADWVYLSDFEFFAFCKIVSCTKKLK